MWMKCDRYHCERCGQKRDALKGIRLSSLPPILCVQLKRFDFDFSALRRIKLSHRVRLPHTWPRSELWSDRI